MTTVQKNSTLHGIPTARRQCEFRGLGLLGHRSSSSHLLGGCLAMATLHRVTPRIDPRRPRRGSTYSASISPTPISNLEKKKSIRIQFDCQIGIFRAYLHAFRVPFSGSIILTKGIRANYSIHATWCTLVRVQAPCIRRVVIHTVNVGTCGFISSSLVGIQLKLFQARVYMSARHTSKQQHVCLESVARKPNCTA